MAFPSLHIPSMWTSTSMNMLPQATWRMLHRCRHWLWHPPLLAPWISSSARTQGWSQGPAHGWATQCQKSMGSSCRGLNNRDATPMKLQGFVAACCSPSSCPGPGSAHHQLQVGERTKDWYGSTTIAHALASAKVEPSSPERLKSPYSVNQTGTHSSSAPVASASLSDTSWTSCSCVQIRGWGGGADSACSGELSCGHTRRAAASASANTRTTASAQGVQTGEGPSVSVRKSGTYRHRPSRRRACGYRAPSSLILRGNCRICFWQMFAVIEV